MNKREINSIFVYGTLMSGFRNHDKYLSRYIIEKCQGLMKGKLGRATPFLFKKCRFVYKPRRLEKVFAGQ